MPDYKGKTGSTAVYEYIKDNEGEGFSAFLQEMGHESPLPAHNYELLKPALEQRYQSKLAAYLAERKNNGFVDTPSDIARFRLIWLKDTLNRNVKAWLNPTGTGAIIRHDRPSDQVELEKYEDYILNEIKITESSIQHSIGPIDSDMPVKDDFGRASEESNKLDIKEKLSNRQQALKLAIEKKTVTKEEYGNDVANKHYSLKLRSDRVGFAGETWTKAKYILRDYLTILPTLPAELIAPTQEEMKIIASGHGKDIDEQLIEKLQSL